jgi:hypothetical protein
MTSKLQNMSSYLLHHSTQVRPLTQPNAGCFEIEKLPPESPHGVVFKKYPYTRYLWQLRNDIVLKLV